MDNPIPWWLSCLLRWPTLYLWRVFLPQTFFHLTMVSSWVPSCMKPRTHTRRPSQRLRRDLGCDHPLSPHSLSCNTSLHQVTPLLTELVKREITLDGHHQAALQKKADHQRRQNILLASSWKTDCRVIRGGTAGRDLKVASRSSKPLLDYTDRMKWVLPTTRELGRRSRVSEETSANGQFADWWDPTERTQLRCS